MKYLKTYEIKNLRNVEFEKFLNKVAKLFGDNYYIENRPFDTYDVYYIHIKKGIIDEMISKLIIDDYELGFEIYTKEYEINFLLVNYFNILNELNLEKNYTNHSINYEYKIFNKYLFLKHLDINKFKIFIDSNKYNI